MGRRGRPPKVKAVLWRASVSCSDRESSSSPDRYLFQSSLPHEDVSVASSPSCKAVPGTVGLSWVSVLQSSSQSGKALSQVVTSPSVALL